MYVLTLCYRHVGTDCTKLVFYFFSTFSPYNLCFLHEYRLLFIDAYLNLLYVPSFNYLFIIRSFLLFFVRSVAHPIIHSPFIIHWVIFHSIIQPVISQSFIYSVFFPVNHLFSLSFTGCAGKAVCLSSTNQINVIIPLPSIWPGRGKLDNNRVPLRHPVCTGPSELPTVSHTAPVRGPGIPRGLRSQFDPENAVLFQLGLGSFISGTRHLVTVISLHKTILENSTITKLLHNSSIQLRSEKIFMRHQKQESDRQIYCSLGCLPRPMGAWYFIAIHLSVRLSTNLNLVFNFRSIRSANLLLFSTHIHWVTLLDGVNVCPSCDLDPSKPRRPYSVHGLF